MRKGGRKNDRQSARGLADVDQNSEASDSPANIVEPKRSRLVAKKRASLIESFRSGMYLTHAAARARVSVAAVTSWIRKGRDELNAIGMSVAEAEAAGVVVSDVARFAEDALAAKADLIFECHDVIRRAIRGELEYHDRTGKPYEDPESAFKLLSRLFPAYYSEITQHVVRDDFEKLETEADSRDVSRRMAEILGFGIDPLALPGDDDDEVDGFDDDDDAIDVEGSG